MPICTKCMISCVKYTNFPVVIPRTLVMGGGRTLPHYPSTGASTLGQDTDHLFVPQCWTQIGAHGCQSRMAARQPHAHSTKLFRVDALSLSEVCVRTSAGVDSFSFSFRWNCRRADHVGPSIDAEVSPTRLVRSTTPLHLLCHRAAPTYDHVVTCWRPVRRRQRHLPSKHVNSPAYRHQYTRGAVPSSLVVFVRCPCRIFRRSAGFCNSLWK